jgi:glycosyltransferase involved in cell wall biosynthesis
MTSEERMSAIEPPRKPAPGKQRIAIVTPDILGPVRNGGVGTACWEIATVLARAGHGVTLFFAPTTETQVSDLAYWQEHFLNHGIALVMATTPRFRLECQLPMQRAYAVYEQLRRYAFDVIHFPDMHGIGYYCFLAKKQGLDFQSTALSVHLHGPNAWHHEFNEEDLSTQDEIIMDFMERKSVELADHLTLSHPSILEWLDRRDWQRSGTLSILPLPCETLSDKKIAEESQLVRPNELVLFGRIESRKGVRVFCDALDLLAGQDVLPRRITFLGKPGRVCKGDAVQYIRERSGTWPFAVNFLTELDRDAALEYLGEGRKLAVLPYRAETFGYTLEECLRRGIPFIASSLPVFLERVEKQFHQNCFFDGTAKGLAASLKLAIQHGVRAARPVDAKESSSQKWIDWHENMPKTTHQTRVTSGLKEPLVSVCITHRNRSEYLTQAIQSILNQTYRNFEVIVSDDASDSPAAVSFLEQLTKDFSARGWSVIRHAERSGPGPCRNRAVAKARGEFVLLMDDDNLAKPDELETFVRAAQTSGDDILTCLFDRISDKEAAGSGKIESRWLCLGGDLSSGFFSNVYGDMNAFIRKSAYLSIGGVSEEKDVGCEDWEFFARAVAMGYRLSAVPRSLFLYRDHESSYTRRVDIFKSRMLPSTVYSRALPKNSIAALISYFGSHLTYDINPPSPIRFSDLGNPIYGRVSGDDIYQFDEDYGQVLFDLFSAEDRKRLAPLRQVAMEIMDGVLEINSEGDDPGFEIQASEQLKSDSVLIDVEIECSKETTFQFFYRTTKNSHYDEKLSYSKKLRTGLNGFRIKLEAPGIHGPFRVDPAASSGTFKLKRLIIRSGS